MTADGIARELADLAPLIARTGAGARRTFLAALRLELLTLAPGDELETIPDAAARMGVDPTAALVLPRKVAR